MYSDKIWFWPTYSKSNWSGVDWLRCFNLFHSYKTCILSILLITKYLFATILHLNQNKKKPQQDYRPCHLGMMILLCFCLQLPSLPARSRGGICFRHDARIFIKESWHTWWGDCMAGRHCMWTWWPCSWIPSKIFCLSWAGNHLCI